MRNSVLKAVFAAVVAALSVSIVIGGCGGGGGAGVLGGKVLGTTIDGATGMGLGGVQVAVEVAAGDWRAAMSTTPDGAFTIARVPVGVYNGLRIAPDPVLYGPARVIPVTIVVVQGGSAVLPGPILIIDEFPPNAP